MMLNMLVGISGSGKSTYAKLLEKDGFIVLSSDAIRLELYGDESDQSHNEQVFAELHKRILANLKAGKRVCYDATNLSAKRRTAFLKMLESNHIDCFKKCTVIYREIEDCIVADDNRERSVGIEVIMRQAKQFEVPTKDEGWDGLYACRSDGGNVTQYRKHASIKMINSLKTYDQRNSHHSLSLGDHLEKCKNVCLDISKEVIMKARNCLIFAGAIHDISKPYCQTLNKHGEYSYYNHHNIGAYISFLYSNTFQQDEMFLIAWLVQYHMEPYFWETDKQKDKFFEKWGESRASLIMILHQADGLAH